MINAPSCLVGSLPDNLDVDLKDVMQADIMNGYAAAAQQQHQQPGDVAAMVANGAGGGSGQVDMAQL